MRSLRKKVYLAAGFYTVSMGTGRKEFHPKKPRPGLEQYVLDAGKGVLAQISSPDVIDECVISNFMASRFCRQANLAGLMPTIDPALELRPSTRVEGACGSGGMGVYTAIKSVLAETADVVLALGVEVQNTVKAVYGADYLALAGHYATERKNGHAFFFPAKFAERCRAYAEKYGRARMREGMARWYVQAIENARRCPKAQEHHNDNPDLLATGMTPPNPSAFMDELNVFDCSKVSDAGAGVLVCSEEGLARAGVPKEKAAQVVGVAQAESSLVEQPRDLTRLDTSAVAVRRALAMAGIGIKDVGVMEIHDCFTITAALAIEAAGLAVPGGGPAFIIEGKSRLDGELPVNPTGGLVGYGHPVGATGVRQAADLLAQVTNQAGPCQVKLSLSRPFGLMINMGGNDKTLTSLVVKSAV
jgi:acetyl-CoA C-acetyltransferase/acetyl-CoA acyltransferase